MKHWLSAALILLTLAAGIVSADYLVVVGKVGAPTPVIAVVDSRSPLPAPNQLGIIQVLRPDGLPVPSVEQQFKIKQADVNRGGAPATKQVLDLAEFALEHGLLQDFVVTMNDLAQREPKNPAVAAFAQVQAALQTPLTQDEDFAARREKNSSNLTRSSKRATTRFSTTPTAITPWCRCASSAWKTFIAAFSTGSP